MFRLLHLIIVVQALAGGPAPVPLDHPLTDLVNRRLWTVNTQYVTGSSDWIHMGGEMQRNPWPAFAKREVHSRQATH